MKHMKWSECSINQKIERLRAGDLVIMVWVTVLSIVLVTVL